MWSCGSDGPGSKIYVRDLRRGTGEPARSGGVPARSRCIRHVVQPSFHLFVAKQYYESAVRRDPRFGGDVLIKLGAIELEDSNTENVGVLWRRALELNPDNSSLRTKLDQLGGTAGT